MKKTLALILAAVMALSLVACAKTPANGRARRPRAPCIT